LVLAGGLALEQLQKGGEARVAVGTRHFDKHYEPAAHLLSQATAVNEQPVTDSGLGRIDLLFGLLAVSASIHRTSFIPIWNYCMMIWSNDRSLNISSTP
jgi:hypothetical protein